MPEKRVAKKEPVVQKSGPGIYVYDPEQHRDRSEDALGKITEANDGRTYLSGFQSVCIELTDGSELEIKMSRDNRGITVRNRGMRITSGIAVRPESSNVVEVLPYD